ncbi:MAG: cell division protein FtsQ/DivIB [Alphaproteobacteria bacterium]|nr:MAG: cell division protein FtsQ/DivIB [Alphaproteobacteria bacterium]
MVGRLARLLARRHESPRRPAAARRGLASRSVRRLTLPLARLRVPRHTGLAACLSFLLGVTAYGVIKGDHVAAIQSAIKDAADAAANAAGMRIATVSLSGQRQVSREEIFAAAGVTDHSSLLFLDVADARARLEAIPWIAEATVRKLYPDRLQITITEREAFALWQREGTVAVIAADGTVLGTKVEPRLASLPFVVGNGAAGKARDFLAVLDRFPAIRDSVRASILVADRRWNLRLKNGIDVRLPNTEVERALETLARFDRDKSLLSRDITAVDLRLPDRLVVRLSDAAAQAREDALKKTAKKKGGDA